MKRILAVANDFIETLRAMENLRGDCLIVGSIVLIETFVLALTHQITGRIPVTTTFSVIFWKWHLPYAISRLWDLFLAPICVFCLYKIRRTEGTGPFEGSRAYYEDDDVFFDIAYYCVAVAFIGGVIFGAVYTPLFLVLTGPAMFVGTIIFCIILATRNWLRNKETKEKIG